MHRFKFTTYMERCCNMLLQAREYSSDLLLVGIVWVNKVMTRIHDVFPYPEEDPEQAFQSHSPQTDMAVAAFRKELEPIAEGQPPDVTSNCEFPMPGACRIYFMLNLSQSCSVLVIKWPCCGCMSPSFTCTPPPPRIRRVVPGGLTDFGVASRPATAWRTHLSPFQRK
jgi:hypothetical protein